MSRYDYILDRIAASPFTEVPFRHLYIENVLNEADFQVLIRAPEIDVQPVGSDEALIEALHGLGYKEIQFPGTTTDLPTYLNWHRDRKRQKDINNGNCEGFGVTLRLQHPPETPALRELDAFFRSPAFSDALAQKFNLDTKACTFDFGLQKYLDGYEISPHADIRRKALTLMLNINPAPKAEALDIHTHYMRFKPAQRHIGEQWVANPHMERGWVSWDYCETIAQQTHNNSVVMFAPADDTLHAVKANYNHLVTQRTQYYANLWYKINPTDTAKARLASVA
ncbi:hypothetical protein C8P66_105112 [Humitalea rosea]|uniref:2-oxoglutarate-Fe(II)-dependent oxygenase superfamily protein n=1 Tax=Humitalea rosea TaxID=990373 RepID=A0A2W7IN27_9PROT|nr:hypothetical protein [Humitalea rosea]PZW48363.1 hypothetical protein C8P66_105112 [Humitalea rosea]